MAACPVGGAVCHRLELHGEKMNDKWSPSKFAAFSSVIKALLFFTDQGGQINCEQNSQIQGRNHRNNSRAHFVLFITLRQMSQPSKLVPHRFCRVHRTHLDRFGCIRTCVKS